MKDLKTQYNVQTSFTSFVYFNYFIHNTSIREILAKLKKTAQKALDNVLIDMNGKYEEYCKITNTDYKKIEYNTQVLEYKEVYKLAKDVYEGDLDVYIQEITDECISRNVDKREIPLEITKNLCAIIGIKIPTIVTFFAAPYCPHNTLKDEEEEEKKTYKEISKIVTEFGEKSKEKFEVMQFFPSLTDSSYLKIDDDNESINLLIDNFPQYERLYNVPLKTIKKLNIPAINFGSYGKDAHKWTERVYMPYTFKVLPDLIMETLQNYFLD